MIIYTFWDDTEEAGIVACTSLSKARSERAKRFPKPYRPDILQVQIADRLTKADACNLLMQKSYAVNMKDMDV